MVTAMQDYLTQRIGAGRSLPITADQLVRTFDSCDRTAVYRSMCCKFDAIVRRTDAMPVCNCCRKSTIWYLIRDLGVRATAA